MARVLSRATTLAGSLSESITILIGRRGYSRSAAAAAGGVMGRPSPPPPSVVENVVRKVVTVDSGASALSQSNSWIPDPVTGYYRPANRLMEVDAAELRQMFLSHSHKE